MKIKFTILCCLLLICSSCSKQENLYSNHTAPVKLAPYLYEITYSDYKPVNTERYVHTLENVSQGGGCTVVRNGNLIGRNFDYFYSEMAEFIIHVPAAPGRYASIGVATSIFELTAERAENDPYGQYFDILPYVTVDGINEKGVFCDVNMVSSEHHYATSGTNPSASETLYLSMAVRYVLDNCASVAEAREALASKNIAFCKALGEFHFFIADPKETMIVEFFDNKMVCKKPKDEILTNFYVLTDKFMNSNDPGTQPTGTERYDYALKHLGEFTSVNAAAAVMEGMKYSKSYDPSTSPFWYSENYGDKYKGKTIDINTPKEEYADYLAKDAKEFKETKRDYARGFWTTTHTSIYDLKNLTLRVYCQENYDNPIEFTLK